MKTKKNNTHVFSDRIYHFIEEGYFFWILLFTMTVIIAAAIVSGGMSAVKKNITEIFSKEKETRYEIIKVSRMPEKKAEEKKQSAAVQDDVLTEEEVKKKYNAYIVSKIEKHKIYPESEQKKGHEGSVLLEIHLARNGTVSKVRILRQARYVQLTKAAVESIRSALPFAAFPHQLRDEELVFTLEMRFNLY